MTDREPVARALDLVSKPDLLVRFQVSREVLEARLRERHRNLGLIQKLLEVDLQSSLDHIDQVDLVSRRVESFGLPTIRVESLDRRGLTAATEKIAREVFDRIRPTGPKSVVIGSGREGRLPQSHHSRFDARA